MQGHLWYAFLLISGDDGSAASMQCNVENTALQPGCKVIHIGI